MIFGEVFTQHQSCLGIRSSQTSILLGNIWNCGSDGVHISHVAVKQFWMILKPVNQVTLIVTFYRATLC